MGCSPSKGKLFPEPAAPPHAPPAAPEKDSVVSTPGDRESQCLADEGVEAAPLSTETETQRADTAAETALDTALGPEGTGGVELTLTATPGVERPHAEEKTDKVDKRRRQRRARRAEKERKASVVRTKVDFPPHMVRAHQAAYAYLNPNISKCDALLELLDQAAQTQVSLRPALTALVLRFEEVNQALEEMAEEGELMLKEHGDYMSWSSGMIALPPAAPNAKPGTDPTLGPSEPPPDLLQQLLQHTTEKMKSVGFSIQGLGDNTLEEAVEYFASLSELLSLRLLAKRAAEQRLAQVLARVEEATARKLNPEDVSLHSEDSGIGGENESLAGSERHRRHRGSAGSGSTGSGGTIRAALGSLPNHFPHHVGLDENEEEDEEEEEEEDEEEEEEEEEEDRTPERKRSSSSPPDPSRPLLGADRERAQGRQPRRPTTAAPRAARREHSSAAECVNMLLDLQRNQRDLDDRMKRMSGCWEGGETTGPRRSPHAGGPRRHSSNQAPCSLPPLDAQPPGRHTVRRLINTFSQGVDGRAGQSLSNVPPHIRRPRRGGAPLPDIGNGEGVTNGNNNNNSWPESRDDMDMDNLPPPPPEVLMDNSFHQRAEETGDEDEAQEDPDRGRPAAHQRLTASQRLRASVQSVAVLPNRGSVVRGERSLGVSPARPPGTRQDAAGVPAAGYDPEPPPEDEEKATTLYRQARKIIHLRNAAELPATRSEAERRTRGPAPLRAGGGQRQGSCDPYEADAYPCNPPVTAPPVSRVRLPPSCPSVHHRLPPSPPAFKAQPTSSRPSSRSSSRPGSPRLLTRAKMNSAEEIVPSVSFCDARSVFCQNGGQSPVRTRSPSDSPTRGGLWGGGEAASRGRRTQSERRPRRAPEGPRDPDARRAQRGCQTMAVTHTERPDSPPVTDEDCQSDPSAAVATA